MEKLHSAIQVRLAKENIFFGPGVLTLLELVKEYESLNAAAKKMNLSYSKAFKMIKGTEEALGFKLLDRKIGGAGGGGSNLTPECIKFMKNFKSYVKDLNNYSNEIFDRYFGDYM